MGLTGFNRARREAAKAAAKAAAATAEKVDVKVDGVDGITANETAVIVEPETEKVDGIPAVVSPVSGQVPVASKTELRAQADEIAQRLGIKKPIVRAGVLDLLAFIEEHK